MNIAISGASGFIGSHLSNLLKEKEHNIFPLSRRIIKDESKLFQILSKCQVVINLAGANIKNKWTEEYKDEILSSRINTTKRIVHCIGTLNKKPELFISASAVGIYPSDKNYDENTPLTADNTYLAEVTKRWETEAFKCSEMTRTVICRFGVVLDKNEGALNSILISYKFKTAVTFSCSDNAFPWISISDLCNAILYIINNKDIKGIVNIVSPEIISYKDLINALNKVYSPILKIKIPFSIINKIMGENSQVLKAGQRVEPGVLISSGYKFINPTIISFTESLKSKQ